jgi:DNA-binding NarL/FixJ family response regulator
VLSAYWFYLFSIFGGWLMSSAWDTDAVLSWGRQCLDSGPSRIEVVVVDDLPGYLEILGELHRFEDVVDIVGRATNIADALELIATVEPDLVVINVAGPSADSLTLARFVYTWFPDVTVVMLSVTNSPALRATWLTSGAQAFIHKPDFQSEFERVLPSRSSQVFEPNITGIDLGGMD